MTFDEYQAFAQTTDVSGSSDHPITSPHFFNKLLGLVGETAEIAEKFKKIYRDNDSKFTAENKAEIEKELGDVLWYISVMSTYLGISLEDVAAKNKAKLSSRKERGALRGSGDNR